MMQMMQQLTGINFISYFGTVFFTSLGIFNPFLITLIITLVNTCATISFWTIKKFGRRQILLLGAMSMIISQFIVVIIGSTAGQS
jgi:hypothetical protein